MIQLVTDISTLINQGGWLVVLLLVLVSGYLGMWVFGPEHKRVVAERDALFKLAVTGTRLAEQGLALHEQQKKQGLE